MKPILEISHISKKFKIRHQLVPYLSLRDRIVERLKFHRTTSSEEFWALKDIDFNVNAGESVGIIGKNGAGKSTLLKILSKITLPSSGRIISRGRIASLLEVGTGFHPELTGRENIFLNGSILGMKRREIRTKFDEIVDFSGVENFLDTPLKHYSSGMQLRLAFAVAAFLEPEVLIIDEVLAVGDAAFQKKCIGKMDEVAKSGRTILFVSHNMTAVTSLCSRCIHINKGLIAAQGNPDEVINDYLKGSTEQTNIRDYEMSGIVVGDDLAKLLRTRLVNTSGETIEYIAIEEACGIEMVFEIKKAGMHPVPNIHFYTGKGECAFIGSIDPKDKFSQPGTYSATMWIPPHFLNSGTYSAGPALSTFNPTVVHFYEAEAIIFDVIEDFNKRETDYISTIPGVVRPKTEWNIEKL
jgi:lipopolysaccharide transport system ATP-binding protein